MEQIPGFRMPPEAIERGKGGEEVHGAFVTGKRAESWSLTQPRLRMALGGMRLAPPSGRAVRHSR